MTENIEKEENHIIIFKSVSLIDKYNFYEYLWVMIDWWVSVTESLESVNSKITSVYFKEKISELITYISSWDSFSKSMKKIPSVFSLDEISLIEAWENTGELSKSFMKLSDNLKKHYNLRKKIKWSLTYPLIIFLFLGLAMTVVLTFVIPAIKPLFDNSWVELPAATQALLATSDFLINNYLQLILFLMTLVVIFMWYKNTKSWRASVETFLLTFPLIWKVYKNYILSNIASNMWNLIWSWVGIVKTLTLVWKSTNNSIYEDLFNEVIVKVSAWWKIVDSMREVDEEKKYFPADFLQMLSVWERTASIDTITIKLNTQYEREVDYSLWNLTKWIEPLAILLAWIFVLWFAFAIFWAILKVTETVS